MAALEFRSDLARRRYADVVAAASATVVALDFDGTLAPIVEDPDQAHAHPEAFDALLGLSDLVQCVAVVTGRPVRQALTLGNLDEIGVHFAKEGRHFEVLGQYGNERWSAEDPRVRSARPPRGLVSVMSALPRVLREAGAQGAHVEEKGLAVAVHTRRLEDPSEALERVIPRLGRVAQEHGMVLEPGRMVVEVRAPGMNKGAALRTLQKEQHADAMVFCGDDLGDLEAFQAVASLRRGGMAGLLVCSGSTEQQALVELADVVVPGPDGMMAFLRQLADDARAAR